jgi:hypothetical protein
MNALVSTIDIRHHTLIPSDAINDFPIDTGLLSLNPTVDLPEQPIRSVDNIEKVIIVTTNFFILIAPSSGPLSSCLDSLQQMFLVVSALTTLAAIPVIVVTHQEKHNRSRVKKS